MQGAADTVERMQRAMAEALVELRQQYEAPPRPALTLVPGGLAPGDPPRKARWRPRLTVVRE